MIDVTFDCDEVAAYVRGAFGRLAVPRNATPHHRARIATVTQPAVFLDGERLALPPAAAQTPFLTGFYGVSRIVSSALGRNPRYHAFFGAALALEGRGVALVARGETGKTTLALAAVERGARLITDEFVAIARSTRALTGVSRALCLREPGLPLLDPRLRALCDPARARVAAGGFLAWDDIDPADAFGAQAWSERPVRLDALVLLERDGRHTTSCESIPSAAAAVELARFLDSPATGFGRVAEVAVALRGVAALRLRLGAPGAAADILRERILQCTTSN